MKAHTNTHKFNRELLASALTLAVACVAGGQSVALAGAEQSTSVVAQATTIITKEPDAKSPLSPDTPAIRMEGSSGAPVPLAPETAAALQNALSTSSKGLVEEPIPTGVGGTMVNLQGRFLQTMTVTEDAEGKVSAHCESNAAGGMPSQAADTPQGAPSHQ